MPTEEQLANRLNPTAVNINTPTTGLFRGVGNNGDSIFGTDPSTGKLVTYDLSSLNTTGASYGDRYSVMLRNLKSQYGIDYNSLPAVNMGDFIQSLGRRGIGSNNADGVLQNYMISGDLNSLKTQQAPATLQTSTINNTPNTISPLAQTPVNGQNFQTILGQGQTPAVTVPTSGEVVGQYQGKPIYKKS